MQTEVRLFATLREGRGKKVEVEIGSKGTVQDILTILDIPADQASLILINGKDAGLNSQLEEGDYLSLFPPVGGG